MFAPSRRRITHLRALGALVVLAVTLPALALAAGHSEKLSSYKIAGASSAEHGKVTFNVRNTSGEDHEMVVVKTATKADKLRVKHGKASERGSVGEVELKAHKSKRLTLNLAKGHYVLLCNFKGHYKAGMHKDFTVK